jgi:hypothetical protein
MVHLDSSPVPKHSSRRRGFRWWGGLADFCAAVPLAWCLGYSIALLLAGAHVGRQSSTFAIGAFLPLLAAPFLAALGLAVGRLATRLLGDRLPVASRSLRWCAVLALTLVCVLAAWRAGAPVLAAGREAMPRVLVNTVQIQKSPTSAPPDNLQRATRVYDRVRKLDSPIQWEDRTVRLTNAGDALELRSVETATPLRIPLPGIDYIICIDALPLRMGADARPVLALLITGRATGRRDLIALVGRNDELLYLELLERSWDFREVPLAIAPAAGGGVVLVGSGAQGLLAFAP